jgi:hypothetical protein
MSHFADRVRDTTTSTGVGSLTLANAAPAGSVTYAAGFGSDTRMVAYVVQHQTPGEWEVGQGIFNGTTGLTRAVVKSSSNAGALVNFSAGIKDVFCAPSADYLDGSSIGAQYAMMRGWAMP